MSTKRTNGPWPLSSVCHQFPTFPFLKAKMGKWGLWREKGKGKVRNPVFPIAITQSSFENSIAYSVVESFFSFSLLFFFFSPLALLVFLIDHFLLILDSSSCRAWSPSYEAHGGHQKTKRQMGHDRPRGQRISGAEPLTILVSFASSVLRVPVEIVDSERLAFFVRSKKRK